MKFFSQPNYDFWGFWFSQEKDIEKKNHWTFLDKDLKVPFDFPIKEWLLNNFQI